MGVASVIGFVISALLFTAVCAFAVNVQKEGKTKRAPAPPPGTLGLYELAYLAGGPARTADLALLAAQARGTLGIAANGQVAVQREDTADALAADVVGAVHAGGAGATLASTRAALADRPSVRASRDRLFALGFLNPAAHNPRLRPARIGLGTVPLIAIAGLFLESYAGSPSDDTAVWVANLILVLLGTTACAGAAYLLFSRYDKLRAPLTDSAIHFLWSQVRDEQGLTALAAAVPGGAGLGKVALGGPGAGADPGVSSAFGQAAQATSDRIVSDGWTEQQWINNANVQGPLVGPSYLDLHQQASSAYPGGQQAPQMPGANLGFQVPPQGGGHGAQPYSPYADGPPVWENAPGASGGADGGGEPA